MQVQRGSEAWTTLTPADFLKIPLVDRIQLLVARKLRFLSAGVEISPVEALRD